VPTLPRIPLKQKWRKPQSERRESTPNLTQTIVIPSRFGGAKAPRTCRGTCFFADTATDPAKQKWHKPKSQGREGTLTLTQTIVIPSRFEGAKAPRTRRGTCFCADTKQIWHKPKSLRRQLTLYLHYINPHTPKGTH
jgi:hypothetical protein